MKIRREEHMAGGNGHVIIKEILDAEQLNGLERIAVLERIDTDLVFRNR